MREKLLYRKILTALITLIAFSIGLALLILVLLDVRVPSDFISFPVVIAFYATPFMLFGVIISLVIEYVFLKKQFKSVVIYIFLHMLAGTVSYLLFSEWLGIIYGWIAALLFAIVDRILWARKIKESKIIMGIVIVIGVYAIFTMIIGFAF